MNAKKLFIGIILFGCAGLSLQCTGEAPNAGNSSQTPNAIVGTLYEPGGKTPARGVAVHLRPRGTLAMTVGGGLSKISRDSGSVTTDDAGQFVFDTSLTTGIYVIEASNGTNAVFIDSVHVRNNSRTDTLPPDTLRPAGAVSGMIRLTGGGDPREVYVLAFGIDRFARVKQDGSFIFHPLAQGKYDLRIITSLPDYTPRDMNGISVDPSDTIDLGTVELRFTGILAPSGVTLAYDSASQHPAISWNRQDTSTVKGYNVYAVNISSTGTHNRKYSTTDTFFIDTIPVWRSTIRKYQVVAVDRIMQEGPKSEAVFYKNDVQAAVESGMPVGQGQLSDNFTMAQDAQNNLWVADYGNGTIYKYTQAGTLLTQWRIQPDTAGMPNIPGYQPGALALDSINNVFLKDSHSKSILKYDSSGNLLGKIGDTTGIVFFDICIDRDGYLYANFMKKDGFKQWINKYDRNLALIGSWETGLDISLHHALAACRGYIYCAGSYSYSISDMNPGGQHSIVGFTADGNLINMVVMGADEFAIDSNGIFYGIDAANRMIWMADTESADKGNFEVATGMLSVSGRIFGMAIMDDGTIALGLGNEDSHTGAIHFFRRPQ